MSRQLTARDLVVTVPAASTNYTVTSDHNEVLSVQVVWTSTTASFGYVIQTSNDGINFTDLTASQTILNNNGGTHVQIKGVKDSTYVRVALTKTSGTLTTFKVLVATQMR